MTHISAVARQAIRRWPTSQKVGMERIIEMVSVCHSKMKCFVKIEVNNAIENATAPPSGYTGCNDS